MPSVEIVEVGSRDGVQSVATFIPTGKKLVLIEGLLDAGVGRIEIGSFGSPGGSDIGEIVQRLKPGMACGSRPWYPTSRAPGWRWPPAAPGEVGPAPGNEDSQR